MKKKKWKQIFCRMLAIIMSVLMMPTSVFAQISVDSAKKITANWWPKENEKQRLRDLTDSDYIRRKIPSLP